MLADPSRFKVAAALSLRAWTVKDIVAVTKLPARSVEQALARLTAGELVERDAAGYRLRVEDMQAAARAAADERRRAEAGPEGASAVVARFVKRGRLTSLPTTKAKRAAVLDYVLLGVDRYRWSAETSYRRASSPHCKFGQELCLDRAPRGKGRGRIRHRL